MLDTPVQSRLSGGRGAARGWWRTVLSMISPGGRRGRLAVLIFHRVHAQADPLFPGEMDAARFRERLAWIGQWCNVLPLEDAVTALSAGTLPACACAITFDDGYADNARVALPLLREAGLPATFFIATDYLDGGRMWNDTVIETVRAAPGPVLDLAAAGLGRVELSTPEVRRATIAALLQALKRLPSAEREARVQAVAGAAGASLPDDLMMSAGQVRELAAAGMGIGAHTRSHPILAKIDEATARREIGEGREALAALVGRPIRLFAYPNGKPDADYGVRDVELVRSLGFAAAFSTAWGVGKSDGTPFELPRFTPWDRTRWRFASRFVANHLTPVQRAHP